MWQYLTTQHSIRPEQKCECQPWVPLPSICMATPATVTVHHMHMAHPRCPPSPPASHALLCHGKKIHRRMRIHGGLGSAPAVLFAVDTIQCTDILMGGGHLGGPTTSCILTSPLVYGHHHHIFSLIQEGIEVQPLLAEPTLSLPHLCQVFSHL